jgi:hypothetical protein
VVPAVPAPSLVSVVIRRAAHVVVLRISAIVDAHFSLIVDGKTVSSRVRRGGAQAPGRNVAQPSTISLKRYASEGVSDPVLGLN